MLGKTLNISQWWSNNFVIRDETDILMLIVGSGTVKGDLRQNPPNI